MFQKLKSLFFVTEKDDNTELETKSPPKEAGSSAPVDPDLTPQKEEKFREILLKAIEENNFDGFDYLEFRKSIISLEELNKDVDARYQAALNMLKAMGASPQKIIDTGKDYLKILESERTKFYQAVERQKVQKIDVNKQEIKHIEKLINDKKLKIEQMNKELVEHTKTRSELISQIDQSEELLNVNKEGFKAAFDTISYEIENDLVKIQSLK